MDEISLRGAKGVLINITGGYDLTLFELDEAANRIREEVDQDANIIVGGSTLDPDIDGNMRVSVVATGIDAAEVMQDIPVPRRRLSEPLATATEVEEPAPPAAPPVETPPAPIAAEETPPAAERTLFDQGGLDATAAAAEEQVENVFPAEEAGRDLPPPAYQPQQAQQEPVAPAAPPHQAPPAAYGGGYDGGYEDEAEVAQFVAPKAPPVPGTPPSPEALARLQAAVQNQPRAAGTVQQPQAQQPMQPGADKPRFGINSLINRMTGHGAEAQGQPARQQPPVQAQQTEQAMDPEQEKVEIPPAFLRRQAN